MHPRDREVVARDRLLPGLGTVLEPAALLAALQAAWPGLELSDPRLTYLRYKPGTNCLAAYALVADGEKRLVHATAHRADRPEKLQDAHTKFRGAGAPEPLVLPRKIIVRSFPTDRKLPALGRLHDGAARRRLLQEALPEHPELWGAGLELLRYKPERRLVARLHAPGGSRAFLKLYHAGDFERARAGAAAFSRGAVSSAALLGLDRRHRLLVWRWLDAPSGDAALGARPALAEEVGRALATLHAQPGAGLVPVTRAEEGRPLRAAAEATAYLLPELAPRVRRLALSLENRLRAAPPLCRPVHGDFSAEQLLATPAGVAIIDFDAAALGDPACDLGSFVARLEHGVVRGDLTAAAAAALHAGLESGYGAPPPRVGLYTAAGLLRLAPHAFRTRRAGWPDETLALLERAEALADAAPDSEPGVPPAAPPLSGRASGAEPLEADPGLRFAAGALEPATISPHLNERFGPCRVHRAELRRHKAGRRALIGYTLERREGAVSLLGKVRARGTDVKTHALQTFLWRHGFDDASADGVSVAEPLGTLEPFHMTLQRAVPGHNLATLLSSGAEPLMERVAEAAYKLHRTPAPLERRHTARDELTVLRRQLDAVSAAQPRYERRLERILAACEALAGGLPGAPPATLHRDFYPEQLLVDGNRLYLLDLDLCALGDPALDVGNFAAHLREHALRTCGDADALAGLERAFMARYRDLAGVSAEAVGGYTTLSLARHIAISQRLPARRHLTGALLALTEARLGLGRGERVRGGHLPPAYLR